MPLKPSQVLQILQAKQADFKDFSQKVVQVLQKYRQALAEVSQQSAAELTAALAQQTRPGARPLESLGKFPNWVIPGNLTWQSRELSLEWVRERLTGVSTFAVDGSQIFPSKDLSIPVALVQVGWFENPHLPLGTYDKDVILDVMTPAELKTQTHGIPLDRQVNMRRFQMEIERLIQYMEAHTNCQDCLVFLDGSLVATFAEAFEPESRAFYVKCLLNLLRASQQQRVPLVAYIDTSHARDLTKMLQRRSNLPEAPALHDAQLLDKFMQWGDRTPLFLCDRGGDVSHQGILEDYQEQSHSIAFTYLKTHEGYPVRLELPVWIYEAGLLDRVIDWVRGEVIIGGGYPYVVETADQVAVLQTEDRQIFYRILQDWAEEEDLKLRFSRKMVSKVHRRR
jgi:hypothetical protein